MPSKICSQCQRKNGVRTKVCSCGYEFEIKKQLKEKKKDKIQNENEDLDDILEDNKNAEISIYGLIYAPAGDCPIKPKGFKEWKEGVASEECIIEWALALKEFSKGRFAPEAIIYYARYFWDIHSNEFKRVSNIILNTLVVKKVDREESQDFAEI